MKGEGTMVKIKKRKVDSSMSVHMEDDFPAPLVVESFDSLACEWWIIKEIVLRLPQGSGDSSFESVSYLPPKWKGVKGLGNDLKANYPLPTSKLEKDGDEPAI
ncbi:hypothetical protein H5410_040616 [Solanum commersonii]|uniref:Uncharacterized protein n=1 Tax=Solanum commersonii TaxID=4109 RepID=A0A9J5XT18_SOLCO|nr:hypothetical protein H5410_040616 [Solanum commersonii]